MDIICFGQMNWDWCWTGKQHLMSGLAKRGHRVLYVEPDLFSSPRSLAGLMRHYRFEPLSNYNRNIYRFRFALNPLIPWRYAEPVYHHALAAVLRRLKFVNPGVVTLIPKSINAISALDLGPLIYYPVDEMTAFGGTSEAEALRIRQLEDRLVSRADYIFAVSKRLSERLAERKGQQFVSHLPNGADVSHYAPERLATATVDPDLEEFCNGRACVGFIGQIDDRLDQDLVCTIADRLPELAFAFVGRIKDGVPVDEVQKRSNCRFFGYQEFDSLPAFIKRMDLCIVPYVSSELTESCNPLKVYEYLAAGKPVVATRLSGLADVANQICFAASAEEFAALIEQGLREDSEQKSAARREFAEANSWEKRVDVLEAKLSALITESTGSIE